jgi:hypothetical protein
MLYIVTRCVKTEPELPARARPWSSVTSEWSPKPFLTASRWVGSSFGVTQELKRTAIAEGKSDKRFESLRIAHDRMGCGP